MITVHSYCSYKLSPSGFIYGSFEVNNAQAGRYVLSETKNRQIVKISFSNGNVKQIYGMIPNESTYIVLVKKLTYDYGREHDDFGRVVNMNLAFEFSVYDEFDRFLNALEHMQRESGELLCKELANCVIPDREDSNYKMTFDANKFDNWLRTMLSAEDTQNELKNKLIIIAQNADVDHTDEFNNIYQFPAAIKGNEVTIKRINSDKYCYPQEVKKKSFLKEKQLQNDFINASSKLPVVVTVFLASILIVVILVVMLLNT